jgi:hypothetical protein
MHPHMLMYTQTYIRAHPCKLTYIYMCTHAYTYLHTQGKGMSLGLPLACRKLRYTNLVDYKFKPL